MLVIHFVALCNRNYPEIPNIHQLILNRGWNFSLNHLSGDISEVIQCYMTSLHSLFRLVQIQFQIYANLGQQDPSTENKVWRHARYIPSGTIQGKTTQRKPCLQQQDQYQNLLNRCVWYHARTPCNHPRGRFSAHETINQASRSSGLYVDFGRLIEVLANGTKQRNRSKLIWQKDLIKNYVASAALLSRNVGNEVPRRWGDRMFPHHSQLQHQSSFSSLYPVPCLFWTCPPLTSSHET